MQRLAAFSSLIVLALALASSAAAQSTSVYATGFNNPRGLEFGPDGTLYVAEGGVGGENSTVGQCEQTTPPAGPRTGSPDGARISAVSPFGEVSTFADGLPSSQSSPLIGSVVEGVADVAFVDGQMYALIAGGGCSRGNPGTVNGVIRVEADGTWALVADLSAFTMANPTANPGPDFEPDGTPYSMTAVRGELYVAESNRGAIERVNPITGEITRLVDVSASLGEITPTTIADHGKGNLFMSHLGLFPIVPGTQTVYQITPDGAIEPWISGFSAVLDLAFDGQKRLYVLESMTNPGGPGPGQFGSGKVTRIAHTGELETVVSGLTSPTAMTFGPDGALYISNIGFGPPPIGLGEIVRVEVPE